MGVWRATIHGRRTRPDPLAVPAKPWPRPVRGLSDAQQRIVLDLPHEPRFPDQSAFRQRELTPRNAVQAPAEIYATLLDEGGYHCSIRTMYRILDANGEVRERLDQLRHPAYSKPELLATGPNQVWSRDITKLKGSIFSRRIVGWCVADAESAVVFKPLFDDAVAKHAVPPGQLTLHVDRGGPMKAKATAFLLADLGVTKSHSRPHTSNDNPFSDAHFKTLK